MNVRVEALVDRLTVRSPIQAMFRRRSREKLAVLAYHSIDDPERFAEQLDVLVRSARPVTVDQVLGSFKGRALPERAALITFDDADATIVDSAAPALIERGIPAVAFVVASTLDSNQPLWPAEVRDLVRMNGEAPEIAGLDPDDAVRRLKRMPDARRIAVLDALRRTARESAQPVRNLRSSDLPALSSAGIEIGNHTMTHPCLNRCDEETLEFEIGEADRKLRAAGCAPRVLAYPNGDADTRVASTVEAHGYEAAFLFDHRLNPWPIRDRFAVSRLRVNATDTLDRFRAVLSGLHPAFVSMRSGAGAVDGEVR